MRDKKYRVVARVACIILALLCGSVGAYRLGISDDAKIHDSAIIAEGVFVHAWYPPKTCIPNADQPSDVRAYCLRVTTVYKGPVKPGEHVLFYDAFYGSTEGCFVDERTTNLLFLARCRTQPAWAHGDTNVTGLLYAPIEVIGARAGNRLTQYAAWQTILGLALLKPPADSGTVYRALLATSSNAYLRRYLMQHLPGPLTSNDHALLCAFIGEKAQHGPALERALAALRAKAARQGRMTPDDLTNFSVLSGQAEQLRGTAAAALQLLTAHAGVLPVETIARLYPIVGQQQQELMLGMLNTTNIVVCQDTLFETLRADPHWNEKSVARLAALCPDYLKERLRQDDVPLWLAIVCYRALGINGQAVGKQDMPREYLAMNDYSLREIGNLLRGDLFSACCALNNPRILPEWRARLPLLEPLLSSTDGPPRRVLVALMRTLGVPLTRASNGYVANLTAPAQPGPVTLRLEAATNVVRLGDPVRLTLVEAARAGNYAFCISGQCSWAVASRSGETSTGGAFGLWNNVALPRAAFVQISTAMCVRSEHEIGHVIRAPGVYKVRVSKTYPHDGLAAGVDAWTGVAYSSNDFELTVTADNFVPRFAVHDESTMRTVQAAYVEAPGQ
ncbi:MAG: hypothetical protein NTV22_07075 [bacterium]|nr:hypothetical protein [bacterium]